MSEPRICKLLGVRVNQEWTINTMPYQANTYRINKDGDREVKKEDGTWDYASWEALLMWAIEHPELIIPLISWTAEDVEDAKAVQRIFPWAERIKKGEDYVEITTSEEDFLRRFLSTNANLFPSLQSGGTAKLKEILEADNNA